MGNERIKSNLTVQERIMEYLDFLNDGYRIKYRDYDKCFSDGGKINEFWITHKDKIIRVLELINDNGYYDKAREVIFKYLEANSKEGKLSFEERIVEYIENLRNGYDIKANDLNEKFSVFVEKQTGHN